jgi:hypothetical protein
MYSGYHSDTMVNNIFAYGPNGKIFLCAVNFPSSWQDGSIKTNIFPYICNNIGMYKMCVDQGFPQGCNAAYILVGPVNQKHAQTLMLICNLTYYVYPMFSCHCLKQVNALRLIGQLLLHHRIE